MLNSTKNLSCLYFIAVVFVGCTGGISKDVKSVNNGAAAKDSKPNIIYILADDLGYGDLGVYGQELIETPNIDLLAKEGMLFTQHYSSAPVCAPARFSLLTGKHSGHSFIRGNDGWKERGDVWNYKAAIADSTLEGQRPIPSKTVLFPKMLQEQGYKTGMVGKWGLGAPHTDAIPTKMGFDFFYGYNCQRQAHTYYPVHLYKNEKRVYLKNDTIPPGTKLEEGASPYDAKSYEQFNKGLYSPDLMFDKVLSFINQNKDQPFFMYWATPLPHVALQAPARWVNYYVEKFGDEEPYLGQKGYFPSKNPHATYAAMISYLDENVGKLVSYLKSKGLYENTLIVFSSDNGPSFAGGAEPTYFDSAKPFKSEFGRGKGFLYEGGIRVPMIATWPKRIKAGTKTDHVSIQYDLASTLGDLLGFQMPGSDGISFLPTLYGDQQSQLEHEFLMWAYPEYGGQAAIRMDDWKLVRQHLKDQKAPTLELYNLGQDKAERYNVAQKYPDIVAKAVEIFDEQYEEPDLKVFSIPLISESLLIKDQ
ncbi:arylsulfatase [Zhouia amylolytica]|uniref:arylsulfatase n=1 Tax=Zhouia amylolytica TaxID=376730 RepID=UPI0020CF45CD|nr:arylsulfatase [Zhouia amylolytica]MCQ0110053.1 arylsulfatase [Zhouia amylolytica]